MTLRALGIGVCVLLLPFALFAQELRVTEGPTTHISNPESYRAYYGKLTGEPHVYSIATDEPFRLSVIMLAPFVDGARTDFTTTVYDLQRPNEPVIELIGTTTEWRWFFDTSGRDEYLAGPELRGGLPGGSYELRVTNPDNDGMYVLVVGEAGRFSPWGLFSRYSALPKIKAEFFGKPGYQAFLTPLLLWPIIALLTIIAIFVFALYILKRRRASAALAPHTDL